MATSKSLVNEPYLVGVLIGGLGNGNWKRYLYTGLCHASMPARVDVTRVAVIAKYVNILLDWGAVSTPRIILFFDVIFACHLVPVTKYCYHSSHGSIRLCSTTRDRTGLHHDHALERKCSGLAPLPLSKAMDTSPRIHLVRLRT
jgi:hypothetical protein